jgi:hypothetical protein
METDVIRELCEVPTEGWEDSHPELTKRILRLEAARKLVDLSKQNLSIAESALQKEEDEYKQWMKVAQNA